MKRTFRAALLSFGFLALALVARAQNDTFVPHNEEAKAELARGDLALARARISEFEKDWADAFDAWRSALEQSETGELVPLLVQAEADEVWSDADGSFAARSEGVAIAVLRRLSQLSAAESERWRARFDELAQRRFDEAGFAASLLTRVERNFPATNSAALASLQLAERSLEAGAPETARVWLDRGRVHAKLAAASSELRASFERRREWLQTLTPKAKPEPWRTASSLKLEREINLYTRTTGNTPRGYGFDRGLIAGGVFLGDGRIAIHHPAAVFIVDESGAGPIFEPRKLLENFPRRSGATFAPGGQAWPLEPATDGTDLFFVLGRAIVAGNTSAVCRLSPPKATAEAAHLRWVLSTQGHADAAGTITPIEEFLPPGTWEFQPGPVVFESLLLVQARQWLAVESGAATAVDTSRPSCYVIALDIETGKPRWTRFLGKGSDVQRDFGSRFVGGNRPAAPAQPIALRDGKAFCATGVGLGALVDLADGRILWSFRPERREAEEPGWVRAHRPSFVTASGEECVLWGPPDSSRLYWLRAGSNLEGALYAFPEAKIGAAQTVLGSDSVDAILLGSAGAARSLSSLDPRSGEVTQGVRFRRTEEFRGSSLASEKRVFVCTDRTLYVFDRERELLLTDSHGLQSGDSAGGGTVIANGGRVVVLGSNRVFVFEPQ